MEACLEIATKRGNLSRLANAAEALGEGYAQSIIGRMTEFQCDYRGAYGEKKSLVEKNSDEYVKGYLT
jgi:hypothetical protein